MLRSRELKVGDGADALRACGLGSGRGGDGGLMLHMVMAHK